MNRELLQALSNAFGPSGYEEEALRSAEPFLNGLSYENDAMNNLYIRLPGEKRDGRPVLLLDAHLDECGMMVQSIADDGSLRIILLGGMHPTSLPAHSVRIRNRKGEYVRGIIAAEPVHFMTEEERKHTNVAVETLKLDVGAVSREEVIESFGIHEGDPIVPDVSFDYDEKHGLCFGKAFDNRVGCAAIIEIMQRLKEDGDAGNLAVIPTAALAAQEEVGERGATVTAQRVKPDLAIVFEGSPSDDFYFGVQQAQCRMGEGTQIRIMDKSYISNPAFISIAEQIAAKYHIRYQEAVRRGGGTNAGVISLTDHAVPVLVLGVPSRYVHSHYNFCKAADVDATIELAYRLVRELGSDEVNHILRKGILGGRA
jgi:putative aminopeptidase FrvX